MSILLNERDIEFQLYEVLDTEALCRRERYEDHSQETFNASLKTAHTIATKYFADHNAKGDANEPTFDGNKVNMIPETAIAWNAFAEAGFLCAHHDYDNGGMQLPEVILRSCMGYFNAANIASTGYSILSIGAANLIKKFGSETCKNMFLPPMLEGRYSGTMAMTESGQGSSIAHINTSAEPANDGTYLISGQKMFISGGDQSITENIIHLVLARIKGAPDGIKGVSLFIVPKFMVNDDGTTGAHNDVTLAGLLHKMGWHNTTSTVLNFGENGGAVGYLVGDAHQGLKYMFQMMNEARIFVGMAAAVLAYQGYNASLDYARQRPQGNLPSQAGKNKKQVMIVEHADVRRMLLAQKSYAEGALSLCLYASSLFEDQNTAENKEDRMRAECLLDLLTPVVKSWPSKYGCISNDLAIQVLGGAGYIREYPVEQYYRDQRLNPIHEGTEAIHGLDILGRKVMANDMAAFRIFQEEVSATLLAVKKLTKIRELADPVEKSLEALEKVTLSLAEKISENIDLGLANATLYLDVFGRIVASWIWLRQAATAATALERGDTHDDDINFYRGKIQAARYYIQWELPGIYPQIDLLKSCNPVPFDMQDNWF